MKFIYCVLFEFPTSYFFLLFLLDVMQQRRRIGQFFGNMRRHFLMTKFPFWSIMLESILDLAGKHALMLCSLEWDLEHFKQLRKWEFQRYVELCIQKVCKPLLFNNSFQSVLSIYILISILEMLNRSWHISTTPNTTKKKLFGFKLIQQSSMVTLSCLAKKNQNLNLRKKSSVQY